MKETTSKPRYRSAIASLGVLCLSLGILGFVLVQGAGVRAAGSFNPSADIGLSDNETGANADVSSDFDVPKGDYNFDVVITFTPPEFFVASDADVPDGTEVAYLEAVTTLGLINGPCNTSLTVPFDLYDASTDTSDSFDYDPVTEDIASGLWPGFDDVGGLERAIVEYPGFLNVLFPNMTPWARYYGHTYVTAATTHVALQFMVFEPGASLPGVGSFPEEWGYPSVTVLNDTTAPPGASAITDFCTKLSTTNTVFGEADGFAVRTNPCAPGTYTFHSYSRGLPDADGDGFENGLDTCPYDPNDGDVRDPDNQGDEGEATQIGGIPIPLGDAIDSACDPDPTTPCDVGFDDDTHGSDCDEDGFQNRQDNCPLVFNDQEDSDSDGIGDECDDSPGSVDGSRPTREIEINVSITGDDICPVEETPTPTPTPTPTAAVDTDGDTVPDDDEELYGSDPEDADSTPEALGWDEAMNDDTCTDGVDNDGDGLTDAEDEGCAATPTPTPEVTEGETCSPVFPGTYNGLVRIDGVPAAAGYEVVATIDGTEWGSAFVSGGRYAVDIPAQLPISPPCFDGGTLTFEIDGMTCTPSVDWASGVQNVDLDCAAAATPTATPTATPPAPTPTPPPATPTATPVKPPPTGSGGFGSPGSSLPLWAMALLGWAGVMTVAGLGVLTLAKAPGAVGDNSHRRTSLHRTKERFLSLLNRFVRR